MNATRVKIACYSTNVSMATTANLSPLLFLTFRELYGLSFSMMGLLILLGFVTQLAIDLVFSFFSHKFNITLTVRLLPAISVVGLVVYAVLPLLFPALAFIGIILGTLIFSLAGGLAEVLISPVIAALPSDNPDHEMSKLHSVYAWGVVAVVLFSTLFLWGVGKNNWFFLPLVLALIPLFSFFAFLGADIPALKTENVTAGEGAKLLKNGTLWLCVIAIFMGGATECTMAQWASSYLEQSLALPKVYGDIFGVALFSLFLGLGRTLYSKFGKKVELVMFLGSVGASICYLVAAVTPFAILGLVACALTGFCASMLWPGSLISAENKVASGGVFLYAIMAAGGDMGASVAPQLVGIVSDAVASSDFGLSLASSLALTPDQIGMKAGMLVALIFPILASVCFALLMKKPDKPALLNEK